MRKLRNRSRLAPGRATATGVGVPAGTPQWDAVVRRAAVALFFDEADAFLGRRSAVSDAHDRYANIEVAYLLQLLER